MGNTPRFSPSAPITRSSRARISLLMLSRSPITSRETIAYLLQMRDLWAPELGGVLELNLGAALVGGDAAGEGDGLPLIAGEVAKLLCVVSEDDAREGTGLVALTEVEKGRAARGGVGRDEDASDRSI